MNAPPNRRLIGALLAGVLLTLTGGFLALRSAPVGFTTRLIQENGIVEMLSAAGYFACVLLLLAKGGLKPLFTKHWYMPALLILMGLRELDFHKRFTSMGMLKSNFYLSTEVPVLQKLAAILVLATATAAVLLLAKNHLFAFLHQLRRSSPAALGFAFAVAFAVLSKGIDGLARKLAKVDIAVSEQIAGDASLLEELLELGIPAMLLIAVVGTSVKAARIVRPAQAPAERTSRRAA